MKRDKLDSREFYERCQTYRHARDIVPAAPGLPNACEAFEQLKAYIRGQAPRDFPDSRDIVIVILVCWVPISVILLFLCTR